MGLTVVKFTFAAVFVFSTFYAIVTDFRALTIPNWICILLGLLFGVYAVMFLTLEQCLWHVGIAASAFFLGFMFYIFEWFGAGDVKLLSVVMLWAGSENAIFLAALMAAFGSILSVGVITLRRYLAFYPDSALRKTILHHPAKWADQGVCPYGTAIGAAALCTAPAIFAI